MAFTQASRVWWNTAAPGAGTSALVDATVPTTPTADQDSGTVGRHKGAMVVCARSGFTVPLSDTVIDPITGNRVFHRFVDKVPEESESDSNPPLMPQTLEP